MFADHPHHEKITLLDTAFAESDEGMVLTDINSNIIAVNSAFCRMTGYAKTKLIGNTPKIMQSGFHNTQFYKNMWRSIKQKGIWQGEIWDRKLSGEISPRNLKIKPIKNIRNEIIFYLGLMTDHSKLVAMTRLANQDALTGLANRRLFEKRLEHDIAHAQRHQGLIALLYIDLDRFKYINDSCGHRIGDKLLIEVASRLTATIRAEDTAARLGGDEFIIILSQITSAGDVKKVAQKVIEKINNTFHIDDHSLKIGCSIGYSIFPQHSKNLQSLIHVADNAMYQAKKAGRNTYCCN